MSMGTTPYTKDPVHMYCFYKAFGRVPHWRLLLKLDCIGVRGNLLRWIQAFLVSRRQRVVVNSCSSDW